MSEEKNAGMNNGEKTALQDELDPRWRTIFTIFLLVVLGAMIGWVYEMLFYRIDQGHFIRRGQGGPWLPIYGAGALGLVLVTYKRKIHPALIFLITVIGSFVIEFGTGWVLYHCFDGLRLWDYNKEIWNWGNIGGYVCIRSVLIFGVMGVFYSLWAIPGFFKMTEKMSKKKLLAITIPVAVIVLGDVLFSYILKPILF